MKILLSVLTILTFALTAHATPAVGDSVTFKGTWGSEFIEQTLSFTGHKPLKSQLRTGPCLG